nr:hypothetical protein [Tanacetum cinerariifolium]
MFEGTFKLFSKCIDAEGFSRTKRYLGYLRKTLKTAGSNAFTEGGLDRKISLIVIRLYIEGYLQAMLTTMYKHEYLGVRVTDDQVVLKNMPPNSVLIDDIMDLVKGFLASKGFRGKVKEVTLEQDEMKKCMGLMMKE